MVRRSGLSERDEDQKSSCGRERFEETMSEEAKNPVVARPNMSVSIESGTVAHLHGHHVNLKTATGVTGTCLGGFRNLPSGPLTVQDSQLNSQQLAHRENKRLEALPDLPVEAT
jgi:hypothetical protein